ncbi:MAG TPA: hypothetical protein VGJ60_16500 [Chloroflexota bacterium]|jgi:hypothetical protein
MAWTLTGNIKGTTGAQGIQGPPGIQGEQGIQGPPGGAPAWRGEWSASVDYASNDAVSLNGSSYYAAGDPPLGVSPPDAPWQQMAARGETGPAGPAGASNAVYSGEWTWDEQIYLPQPTGSVRSNNANWHAATALYLDRYTALGVDADAAIRAWLKAGNGIRTQVKTDGSIWATFDITADVIFVSGNGRYEVAVTFVDGTPQNPEQPWVPSEPSAGQRIIVSALVDGSASGQWYTGAGTPGPTLGKPGDMYLEGDGDIWQSQADLGWQTTGTNIRGPQGMPGATGDTGAQGAAGIPGEQWFSAAGAPPGATGIVGDWYLDATTGDFFEKTGASAWTQRGNLRGPQGPPYTPVPITISGSRGQIGSTVIEQLLSALATQGLITNSTTP